MSDQTSIDLQALDPGEPTDLVGPAVRRFRIRVVALAVAAVLTSAAVVAAGVIGFSSWKNRGENLNDYFSPTQLALLAGGRSNCSTPSFDLGVAKVTLLQAVHSPQGGWAMLFVVESKNGHPLSDNRPIQGGGAVVRWSSLSVLGATSEGGQVSATPGMTAGTAYLGVPPMAGDQLEIQLHQETQIAGSFKLDLSEGPGCQK
jgi:hypothetical protein